MKRVLSAICMATMIAGAGLSGQSGSTDQSQADKKAMTKEGQMTVSGCVTTGKAEGQYMLTNATMAGRMMGQEKEKTKDPAASAGQASAGHMMSYELVGGSDVKAHVGHKVEVTGTMSKSDMDRMMKMEKMDKERMDKMSDKDMPPMKLNVKSIKMVSSSCS